jgi:sulfur-oxidizing protein SoxY
MNRREMLKSCAASLSLLVLVPLHALAAAWNRKAFEADKVEGALEGLGVQRDEASPDIEIVAPQLAENGAIIQIEVTSRIPDTEAIAIIAEKNPTPLIANFLFSPETEPFVITRIKMAETADLKVVVKAGSRYFSASRRIEVAIGGCG